MKKIYIIIFVFFVYVSNVFGQCYETCNQNVGVFSNNDASTIGYDNLVSSFHSSVVAEEPGFRAWGANLSRTGTDNLVPVLINSANYTGLTGKVYFASLGSSGSSQMIVLTSTGLFANGVAGSVLSTTIKSTVNFTKLVINGKADGLPIGITPDSVKMMFVTFRTIILTTCGGNVYVLSQFQNIRGGGVVGSPTQWSQVLMQNGQPLSGIVATRGNSSFAYAIRNDNTLWTWGDNILLGNGTVKFNASFAMQMVLPTGISKIKMIQATSDDGAASSYYVLDTSNFLFALGDNSYGQLSDNTSTNRTVWVNCKYSNGTIVNDAKWISANEHDNYYPSFAMINSKAQARTAGNNSASMIGRSATVNLLDFPSGISSNDTIHFCEVGGHTTAFIKKNTARYGYVGHLVSGSIGNNSTSNSILSSVNFNMPPTVYVCGTVCDTPAIFKKPFNCQDSIATFIIKGRRNNLVKYVLNNIQDSIIIANNDTAIINVSKPTTYLSFRITQVNSLYCNIDLSLKDTIKLNSIKDTTITICKNKPIFFKNQFINTTGIYIDTLKNVFQCDSIISLNLIVNDTSKKDTFITICESKTVLFNGQILNTSGIYRDTFTNKKGCDSFLILHLTVNPKTFGTIFQNICPGQFFRFNNINRTLAGTYLDTLVNSKGCDSILTLNLTVSSKTFGTINQTICDGQGVFFNGQNRTIAGVYKDTLLNSNGCDSILTLNLTVSSKTFGTISQTICEGSSYLGRILSGTYIDTLFGQNAKGCDSIRTLNLIVNPKTFGTINQTICEGQSFFFNNENLTIAGIYKDTLLNAKGCDSILTLNLTVNPKTYGIISQTICEGQSLFFNYENLTLSGIYKDTLLNTKGCDSILTLNLTVNPKTFGTINQTICDGQGVFFNGQNLTIAGVYKDTLLNVKGCDSILTLNLTVNPKTFGTISQTICEGQSLFFNNENLTIAGIYKDTLLNAKGCDSILTLNLTVSSKTFGTISHTICDGTTFLGRILSGTYIDTLFGQNAKGCDSIRTLNLIVNSKTSGIISQTICEGTSFLGRTMSGTYIDTLFGQNAKGCDSIRTLNLIVNPKTFGTINQTICEGQSVFFNNENLTIAGIYKDTLLNSKGCDSILTLNLTINPKTFGTISHTICEGKTFLFNGLNRTISGTYLDTLVNSKGCDSILTLNLTVNPKTFGAINQTICEGQSVFFNNENLTIAGIYKDTLLNAKGCDSILTLNLTVSSKTFGTISHTICEGTTFLGRILSGTYIDTLFGQNAKGCDSIRTLNLIVNSKTFGTINQTICEGTSFLGRTMSGTYIDTLFGQNAKGCDSIRTLNLIVNPKTSGTINQTICEGQNLFFNNENLTLSGIYKDTLLNAKGCDSILTLKLTVDPKTFGTISQTICEGQSLLFNNENLTLSGIYKDTLLNTKGCDSILTLNLTVNPKTFGTINQTICEGQSVFFNGQNRTIAGVYKDTLLNSKGCDSILTLNLTVSSKTFGTISQTICEGTSFLGRTISGTYIDTLLGQNAKGCDSIRLLNLTVNPKTFSNHKQTICEGEAFFGYTKTGVYQDVFINAKGCDSIRILTLTVNPVSRTIINKRICEGDVFLGKSTEGLHLDTFKNVLGCDSIREINLEVVKPIRKKINQEICEGEKYRGHSKSMIFNDTMHNSIGCDSIIETVDLFVRANIDSSFSVKICEGTTYRGRYFEGYYIDSFQNEFGCKTTLRYNLSVIPKTYGFETRTICYNEVYKGRSKSGNYKDTFVSQYGCDSIFTLTLFVKPNFINSKLKDTTITKGDSVLLQAQKGFLAYSWNTSSKTSGIFATEEGQYNVTVYNHDGCISYDSCVLYTVSKIDTMTEDTTISYIDCPNVFSPNNDFKNDLYKPNYTGIVDIQSFLIFSRNGEKVYEGTGNQVAWDGYYKGVKCEPGVFVYFLEYKKNKITHKKKGSVTLIR